LLCFACLLPVNAELAGCPVNMCCSVLTRTIIRGRNQISMYFNLNPPTLAEYLAPRMYLGPDLGLYLKCYRTCHLHATIAFSIVILFGGRLLCRQGCCCCHRSLLIIVFTHFELELGLLKRQGLTFVSNITQCLRGLALHFCFVSLSVAPTS
jgi:hypothetical protein